MKKIITVAVIAAMLLSLLALTSCGKSEFALSENTAKAMTLEAQNAAPDSFIMVGSLEVADGEQLVIAAELEKGAIKLEFVASAAEQSMDELPELDGAATVTAEVRGTDTQTCPVAAGDYLLRAACLKTATGTVTIAVQPVE